MKAIDKLLDSGAKTVVITSIEVENLPGKLVLLAKNNSGKKVNWAFTFQYCLFYTSADR